MPNQDVPFRLHLFANYMTNVFFLITIINEKNIFSDRIEMQECHLSAANVVASYRCCLSCTAEGGRRSVNMQA